ncbi:hypothetical protein M3Y97_01120200 [Aphelenchoides bicaudatus]|nr:hypothetical protein M3Y97_01120200 [Aphelenchoides bicaudatus]
MDDVKPALYFWSNMDVLFADNDYFKQLASTKFFLHTWSLAVEIQFYLCVPFIFTFLNLNNTYSLKVFLSTIFLLTSLLLYFLCI